LTDTTGFMSPSSGADAACAARAGDGFEHCDQAADPKNKAPARTISRPPRRNWNPSTRRLFNRDAYCCRSSASLVVFAALALRSACIALNSSSVK